MKYKNLGVICVIILLTHNLFSCGPANQQRKQGKIEYIVSTTGMIDDAVRNITGSHLKTNGLMGPGVDPHLYKATQGDLKELTRADIICYNGLHLEGKMGEILQQYNYQKPTVAVGELVNENKLYSPEGYKDAYDPHIWFDVSLWKEAVAALGYRLQEIDTARASIYAENTKNYLHKLDTLHQWVKRKIQTIPEEQSLLITAHDAFHYFGKAYDIEVIGLQGISTTTEFGLQDISSLVNTIVDRNIKAIFVETTVSERSIRAVQEGCEEKRHNVKIGGKLYSDALGKAGTPEGTYIGMVEHNVNTIVNALQ